MDSSDTILLRESTKWWIVGAFLLVGTIFLVSRAGSDTEPVVQEQKLPPVTTATQSTAIDAPPQLVCEGANCPDCFQKIENAPNSNFAAFDPFLTAIADEETETKAEKTKSEEDLKQARANLKAVIEEEDDPLLRRATKTPTTEEKQLVVAPQQEVKKYDGKPLLTFVEKVPTDSDEWKKLSVEEKVARYLKMKVTFEPSKLLIDELVHQLGEVLDIEVTVNKVALEEATYDTSTRLSIKSKRPRPLKSLLVETLRTHGLSYIIKNEALVLTSEAMQKESMVTKIYPVADLVMPLATEEDESPQPDYESLINLIQTTVQPKTWKEVSGDDNGGTIDRHQTTHVLVVRNTTEVHDELQELLTQLRTVKSPSAKKPQNVADFVPEQPDKIVRRIYYISELQQIGRSGAGAGRRGPGAYGGFIGGGMSGGGSMGGSGDKRDTHSKHGGGLFSIKDEKDQQSSPTTLSTQNASSIAAQFSGNTPPAQQPTPNPQTTGGNTGTTPPGAFGQTSNPNSTHQNGGSMQLTPSEQSMENRDFLNAAQMKARMESLVDIIPGTVDPANWDKEKTTISNMENRLIIINTVASQIEIEKFLRGLKVLSRVESW